MFVGSGREEPLVEFRVPNDVIELLSKFNALDFTRLKAYLRGGFRRAASDHEARLTREKGMEKLREKMAKPI